MELKISLVSSTLLICWCCALWSHIYVSYKINRKDNHSEKPSYIINCVKWLQQAISNLLHDGNGVGRKFRCLPWIWLWGWGLKAVVWFKEALGLGAGAGWCGLTLIAVRRNCSSSLRRSEKDKLPVFVCSSSFWRCPIMETLWVERENEKLSYWHIQPEAVYNYPLQHSENQWSVPYYVGMISNSLTKILHFVGSKTNLRWIGVETLILQRNAYITLLVHTVHYNRV